MKITLDRVALKALLDNDRDFEFELQAAVTSEIVRRFFDKDAKRVIAAASPELFAKVVKAVQESTDMVRIVNDALEASLINRTTGWSASVTIKDDTRRVINEQVERSKALILNDATAAVTNAYGNAIEKALATKLDPEEIDRRVNNRLERLLDAEIDRRVNEKLNERIAALNAALKG